MTEWLTTGEAARITRHASAVTFLRWARRCYPEILHRPDGRRSYMVDGDALRRVLNPEENAAPCDTLEHVEALLHGEPLD